MLGAEVLFSPRHQVYHILGLMSRGNNTVFHPFVSLFSTRHCVAFFVFRLFGGCLQTFRQSVSGSRAVKITKNTTMIYAFCYYFRLSNICFLTNMIKCDKLYHAYLDNNR